MATNERAVRTPAKALLAYVLHRYDWSETSLIVELFTRAQGRVVVVAKGAKRPTSNFRPVLLPFAPLTALLGKTPADEHGELHTLRSAEWVGGAPLLAAGALFNGFYLNELLLKLLARQDPHAVLFDAYADTLAALSGAATPGDEAAVLRAFELTLLRTLGWLPDLASDSVSAAPVQPQALYTLQPQTGLVPHTAGLPGTVWVALEAALGYGGERGGRQGGGHGGRQGGRPGGGPGGSHDSGQGSDSVGQRGSNGADPGGSHDGSGAALRAACRPVAERLRLPLRGLLDDHLGHGSLRTRQVWQGVQRLAQRSAVPALPASVPPSVPPSVPASLPASVPGPVPVPMANSR